jgi:hypothetical protein
VKPPRWVLAVTALAVAVIAVDAAIVVVARHSDGTAAAQASSAGHADAVAVIDPVQRRVTAHIGVGHLPTSIVAGYGSVWVLNRGEGTLTHIDPKDRHVVAKVEPDAVAADLSLGAGGVWFAGHTRSRRDVPIEQTSFERLNPSTGAVNRTFDTQMGPVAFAAAGRSLWASGFVSGRVRGAARSDSSSGLMEPVDVGFFGDLVTADDSAAYYVASIGNRVARISTRSGRLTQALKLVSDASLAAGNVPSSPTDVVIGGGAVWISKSDGSILRVDQRLGGIVASIPACHNALALAYGEGGVWVACGDGSVVRIDPEQDRAGPEIRVGGLPRGIAAGEGAVWVTLN